MDVLGIDVEASVVRRWAGWLAPDRQPFFLTADEVAELGLEPDRSGRDLPVALCDTYEVWNHPGGLEVGWLDEREFGELPRDVRARLVQAQVANRRGAVPAVDDWADLVDARVLREQADGQRFVWWPYLLASRTDAILERVVSDGHLPCQRMSVSEDVWQAAASMLPRARALSGTFANEGGANCFATVLAAAGVPDVAETLLPREPFEAWLAANRVAGGADDDRPGTVLVWRDSDQISQHAAVALGGGWALHKPGRDWVSPRQVVTVHDLIRTAPPGVTLHRYALKDADERT